MAGSAVSSLRIVLLGDGEWAARSLDALRRTPHRVVAAVLRERPSDDSLPRAARDAGLPVRQPHRVNTPEMHDWLAALGPDLLLSVAYNQIVRGPVRAVARHGALNLHAGKLPFYRGRNVINWALINGEPEIGITAHFMDDGIDTGDIVLQRTLPIGWTDTYGTVLQRVTDALPALATDAVALIAAGDPPVRSQRGLPATYFGGRGEGDEWLDWSASSASLHNKIRAITRPGPGARTALDGAPVVIWRAFFDPAWPRYIATPGQVVGRSAEGVTVKTGDATLLILEAAVDGAPGTIPDWPIGTRLEVNRSAALEERLERLERRLLLEAGS
jgi:methionyl-tRNA formyltransferase